MKRPYLAVLLALFALAAAPGASATPFTNGDFSAAPNPFAGWQGQTDDGLGLVNVDPGSTPNHYATPGGGAAELSFDATGDPFVFVVTLFQDFTINPLATAIDVGFDWDWNPSDSGFDSVSAMIESGPTFFDLFGGLTPAQIAAGGTGRTVHIDSTGLSTSSLAMQFTLEDFDFNLADTFRVANISVTEQFASAIDEPASLGLLALGLALVPGRRRRTSATG